MPKKNGEKKNMSPAQLANLKPIQKGETRGGSRPLGSVSLKNMLQKMLSDENGRLAETIVKGLAIRAIKENEAFKIVADLNGEPIAAKQETELSGGLSIKVVYDNAPEPSSGPTES